MKIAIVVHGRFHVFDLARALSNRGHEVTLFTNYPKWAVNRFGVKKEQVRSFWLHGVVSRGIRFLPKRSFPFLEVWLHKSFGSWAANRVKGGSWDVVFCMSGVAEETLRTLISSRTLRICHRGASPIQVQARILQEEENRVGIQLERPSPWIIAREEREYSLADVIYVPSSFAEEAFLNEGFSSRKLMMIPLGVNVEAFRPKLQVIKDRCKRILLGTPLCVLNVGTFSFRKGMWDFAEVVMRLKKYNFRFRFVGPIHPEARFLVSELRQFMKFIPKHSQGKLVNCYETGDIFLFPTIEDGYAVVLAQASAAGLPILTTPHSAGKDLVQEGETGWILPVRSPQAFVERLQWCDTHRKELAEMVGRIYNEFRPRDWSDVARDFEQICLENKEHVEQ